MDSYKSRDAEILSFAIVPTVDTVAVPAQGLSGIKPFFYRHLVDRQSAEAERLAKPGTSKGLSVFPGLERDR